MPKSRSPSPLQPELFDLPTPEPDPVTLVTVARPADELGPGQRMFNRLTAQIRRDRERLQAWQDYRTRYDERVASEYLPAIRAVEQAQRQFIWRIDALLDGALPGPKPTRRQRGSLIHLLGGLIAGVLDAGNADPFDEPPRDVELEALRAKYFGADPYADDGDDDVAQDLEQLERLFAGLYGEAAVRGHAAQTVDDLRDHVARHCEAEARAYAEQRQARAEARRARRGQPSRDELAAERRAEAGLSLREVYRRLVSSLHPDREPDPQVRQHKTQLMQRANQAYERRDLLELLTLQIEIEQIDAAHLAELPEQRLQHYNEVLREQSQMLRLQIDEILLQVRRETGKANVRDPATADSALGVAVREALRCRQRIEQDLQALDDPKRRRALLDSLPDVDDDELSDIDFEFLVEMLASGPPPIPPSRPRAGKATAGKAGAGKGKAGKRKRR